MNSNTAHQVSWISALALGAGLWLSSPAHACSGPVCTPDVRVPLPREGAVPANLPALVLSTNMGRLTTQGDEAPRLFRADGGLVETSVVAARDSGSSWHVVPSAPLVPGETYLLRAHSACDLDKFKTVETRFTVGADSPLPTATGTLQVDVMARGPLKVMHSSACSMTLDAGYTRFRFIPAPELVPFLPWVNWRLEVDGEDWATAQHGEVLPDGTVSASAPGPFTLLPRTLFQVHANCGGSKEPGDLGLTPGRHHATLRATLANAPGTLPPVELDFELSCQEPPPEPTPDESSERPSGFGCSHAGGAGTGALLGLLALGTLVWRQTRRDPSRPVRTNTR